MKRASDNAFYVQAKTCISRRIDKRFFVSFLSIYKSKKLTAVGYLFSFWSDVESLHIVSNLIVLRLSEHTTLQQRLNR